MRQLDLTTLTKQHAVAVIVEAEVILSQILVFVLHDFLQVRWIHRVIHLFSFHFCYLEYVIILRIEYILYIVAAGREDDFFPF